jgi:hypothetical protein
MDDDWGTSPWNFSLGTNQHFRPSQLDILADTLSEREIRAGGLDGKSDADVDQRRSSILVAVGLPLRRLMIIATASLLVSAMATAKW